MRRTATVLMLLGALAVVCCGCSSCSHSTFHLGRISIENFDIQTGRGRAERGHLSHPAAVSAGTVGIHRPEARGELGDHMGRD